MPREIWNEGRVVGMSAYETYVKQHVIEDPTTLPATEREWLASSLAMGNSMILNVPATSDTQTDEHYYVDIPLPDNTRLSAANTILAQFFDGDVVYSDNKNLWASRVSNYGSLISNTHSSHPDGSIPGGAISSGIPVSTIEDWDDTKKNQLKAYMRIVDGVVIQPGTWSEWEPLAIPTMDFSADLSRPYPVVRLHIKGKIAYNARPKVLLTGFTIRTVLSGTAGTDSSLQTESPQDGDFLGPAVFPWANKIIFSVPNSYIAYFAGSGDYERLINSPTSEGSVQRKTIKDTPVIDMQATKPETFYEDYQTEEYYKKYSVAYVDPRNITYSVEKFTTLGDPPTDGESVLTVYQKKDIYPPALYGTFVSKTHGHYLNPLDVVAPGSIKAFNGLSAGDLKAYEDTFPGTHAININSDGTIQALKRSGSQTYLVDVTTIETAFLDTWAVNSRGELVPSGQFQASVSGVASRSGYSRPGLARFSNGANALLLNDVTQSPTGSAVLSSLPLSTRPDLGTRSSEPSVDTSQPYIRATTEYVLNGSDPNLNLGNPAIQVYTEWVTAQNSPTLSYANLNWSMLIEALESNRSIDLLGYRLKSARYSLTRDHSSTEGPYLEFGPNTYIYTEGVTTTSEGTRGPKEWYQNPDIAEDNYGGATDNPPNYYSNWTSADHIIRLYVSNIVPRTQLSQSTSPVSSNYMNCVPIGSVLLGAGLGKAGHGLYVCRPFFRKKKVSSAPLSNMVELCWAPFTDTGTPVYNSQGNEVDTTNYSYHTYNN